MNINKLNYEVFMIDYIEGTLNLKDRQHMEQFLAENPELKEEINTYINAPVLTEDKDLIFTNKSKHIQKESRLSPVLWFLLLLISCVSILYLVYPTEEIPEQKPMAQLSNDFDENVQEIPQKQIDRGIVESEEMTMSNVVTLIKEKNFDQKTISNKEKLNKQIASHNIGTLEENLVNDNGKQNTNHVAPISLMEKKSVAESIPVQLAGAEIQTPTRSKFDVISCLSHHTYRPLLQIERDSIVLRRGTTNNSMITSTTNELPDGRKNWWNVFVPQAYKNVELDNNIFASNTLQSSADDLEDSTIPQQLITR